MAQDPEASPYFQERIAGGAPIVRDLPKFELNAYINGYEGRTRLQRLILIGMTSPSLSIDAFKTALRELEKGKDLKDVEMYRQIVAALQKINPDAKGLGDAMWADTQEKKNRAELDRLESELKAYKNNLIKESIRMGNEDLGHFHYQTGNFTESSKAYSRMREYCTTPKHIVEMGLKLLLTNIAQGSWPQAQSQIQKTYSVSSLKGEENEHLHVILEPSHGLCSMGVGDYYEAARRFINCSPAFMTADPFAGITFQKQLLTGNDIAVYGGLCALASMDRNELQHRVLDNTTFRQFLELEPQIRRAISLFCSSKYSACLDVLESYRNDYMLDLYLQPHVKTMYSAVRTKSIVQYFIPFSCVTLDEMQRAFGKKTGEPIEHELVDMIKDQKLKARIDLVDRVLISPPTNPRTALYANALEMAEQYEHQLRLRLVRMNMQNAGLVVQGKGKHSQDGFADVIDPSQMYTQGSMGDSTMMEWRHGEAP